MLVLLEIQKLTTAAKNANISFIFAKYGYGENKKKLYKYSISNIKQLVKFINK